MTTSRNSSVISMALVCLCLFPSIGAAQHEMDIAVLAERFNSTDPNERMAAILEATTAGSAEQFIEVLSLVKRGLGDPDAGVRAISASALHRFAYMAGVTLAPIFEELSLRDALMNAVRDDSAGVRGAAVAALVLSSKPTEDIGALLRQRLRVEENSEVKKALIEAFYANRFSSPDTVTVLIDALDDIHTGVRGHAAQALSQIKPPPPAALPKIVRLLDNPHPSERGQAVSAIANYEAAAEPYLTRLEQLLATETVGVYKTNIRNAIARIKEQTERNN